MSSFLFKILTFGNILLALATLLLVILIKQLVDALRPNLPPGPWGLPFVGYLFNIKPGQLHKQNHELAQKYGDVVSLRFGQQTLILLNTSQTMRDVFKLDEATARPYSPIMQVMIDSGESSLILNTGRAWKFSRKIGARTVGIFGSSKNSKLEDLVTRKVHEMRDAFKETNGKPIATKEIIIPYLTELITHLTFGKEMKRDDPATKKMHEYYGGFSEIIGSVWFTDYFPFTRHFVPQIFNKMRNIMNMFVSVIDNFMDNHERNPNVETLADAVLKAAEETTDEEKQDVNMTTNDIRRIGIDLYDAALFTTSENLEWILLVLASFPEKQAKLHEELKSIMGGRDVSINDEQNLPYAKAVVTEALRFVSNTAIGLGHMATSDIEINGFVIPSGSTILGNIWTINHEPNTFEQPMEFMPERFIKNGIFDQKLAEEVLVFSVGKRRCVGENMAKQELFLITSLLMQTFQVELDPATKDPDVLDGVMTLTLAPKPHKLIFNTI